MELKEGDLLSLVTRDMRKWDEAEPGEVQTDIGKRFFTKTVVSHWVPKELVMGTKPVRVQRVPGQRF